MADFSLFLAHWAHIVPVFLLACGELELETGTEPKLKLISDSKPEWSIQFETSSFCRTEQIYQYKIGPNR